MLKRVGIAVAGATLLVAGAFLAIGHVVGNVSAQDGPRPGQERGERLHAAMPPEGMPEFARMQGERFQRFLGAQFSVMGPEQSPLTVYVTPGRVTSISGSEIVIQPNDPSLGPARYAITERTDIHATPHRGSLQAVTEGDFVSVVSFGDSNEARAITRGVPFNVPGLGPRPGMGPGVAPGFRERIRERVQERLRERGRRGGGEE